MTYNELDAILDPERKLSNEEIVRKRNLFNRYPKQLHKNEIKRIKEKDLMNDLEEEFQKMYGFDKDKE